MRISKRRISHYITLFSALCLTFAEAARFPLGGIMQCKPLADESIYSYVHDIRFKEENVVEFLCDAQHLRLQYNFTNTIFWHKQTILKNSCLVGFVRLVWPANTNFNNCARKTAMCMYKCNASLFSNGWHYL